MAFYSRKSPRIPNFDYASDQYYFVTICTHNKKCIFGEPNALNIFGKIAYRDLCDIPQHFDHLQIDQCIVMPNHIHAIIVVGCDNQDGKRPNLNVALGQYKSGVARKIHKIEPELRIWQRSYHDHIIRSKESYLKIWEYIITNPERWGEDCFFCTF